MYTYIYIYTLYWACSYALRRSSWVSNGSQKVIGSTRCGRDEASGLCQQLFSVWFRLIVSAVDIKNGWYSNIPSPFCGTMQWISAHPSIEAIDGTQANHLLSMVEMLGINFQQKLMAVQTVVARGATRPQNPHQCEDHASRLFKPRPWRLKKKQKTRQPAEAWDVVSSASLIVKEMVLEGSIFHQTPWIIGQVGDILWSAFSILRCNHSATIRPSQQHCEQKSRLEMRFRAWETSWRGHY